MDKIEHQLGGDPQKIEPPRGLARRTFDRLAARHETYRQKMIAHREARFQTKMRSRLWPTDSVGAANAPKSSRPCAGTPRMTPHRITIEPTSLGERGHRYRVNYAGSILIESSRVPALDACRALLALGVTGKLEVWRSGRPWPYMQLEIERAALLTVEESDRQTPRFVRWKPARGCLAECLAKVGGVARDARERNFRAILCLRLPRTWRLHLQDKQALGRPRTLAPRRSEFTFRQPCAGRLR